MVITKKALPRRTFIWGMGAAVALPFLDAMLPAMKAQSKAVPRFTAIYCGNGANMFEWTPATTGVGFEMSPTLKPIEAFRDQMLVVTGLDNFQATDQGDVGGQHPTIDQMIAGKICRDTKLPSLEVSIDRNDVVGACDHGYACAYMNSMSWKSPTDPLPSETNPRFVLERMFGIGATAEERLARSREDRSILDGLTQEISALRRRLGPGDRTKLGQYFDAVRDVEQRIAKAESTNRDFALPEQPAGVPETFKEYIELMFDLQVLAFQADITRVSTLMMARENVNRPYPEIGLPESHHSMSHHGDNPEKMKNYAKLNTYHIETLGYFLKKLRESADSDGNLLDNTVVLWGSGMSDGNVHNNYNVPVVLVGGRNLQVRANRHVKYPKGTPLANLMLGVIDRFGVTADKFGDSTAEIDLLTV
ncbi:MAG: hypothetical protein AUF76_01300 [Acidobacteria bacterium 13_1_20CM_2_65_9]|nr:MAG: hypothetical protein AUF76_01300 [Acidobacteria bacterium 13_1_20CM_2_65_9]